jgi:hypothetical protein
MRATMADSAGTIPRSTSAANSAHAVGLGFFPGPKHLQRRPDLDGRSANVPQGQAAAVRVYENYGANWNFGFKGTFLVASGRLAHSEVHAGRCTRLGAHSCCARSTVEPPTRAQQDSAPTTVTRLFKLLRPRHIDVREQRNDSGSSVRQKFAGSVLPEDLGDFTSTEAGESPRLLDREQCFRRSREWVGRRSGGNVPSGNSRPLTATHERPSATYDPRKNVGVMPSEPKKIRRGSSFWNNVRIGRTSQTAERS